MPEIMYGRHINDNWTPADHARLCKERRDRLGFVPLHHPIPLAAPTKIERTEEEVKEAIEPSPPIVIDSAPEPVFTLHGPNLTAFLPPHWSPDERLAVIINVLSIAAELNVKELFRCSQIGRMVARVFALEFDHLIGCRRNQVFLIPRHLALCLSSLLTTQSVARIGALMKRDHTSVIHANRKQMVRLIRAIMDQGSAPLIERMCQIIEMRGRRFREGAAQAQCFKEAAE